MDLEDKVTDILWPNEGHGNVRSQEWSMKQDQKDTELADDGQLPL